MIGQRLAGMDPRRKAGTAAFDETRVALVHDWLNQLGGAENVLEELVRLFPRAPVYTSMYDRLAMPAFYQEWQICTTFMQRLPAGFAGKAWRQTDGAIYSVVEGHGSVTVTAPGDGAQPVTITYGPRDHFVVP